MFMYTIYYIFGFIIVISFVTGLILNIIEVRHNKNNVTVLEEASNIEESVVAKDCFRDNLSNTISFSTPIIISNVSDDIEILDDGENDNFQKGLFSSADDSIL